MSRQANKSLIGGFVLGAVVLVVAAVLIFGSGKFLTTRNKFVLFFEGSVKGLSQGAPVLFRGVKVGSVLNVKLLADPSALTIVIPVFIEVEPDRFETVREGRLKRRTPRETIQKMIEKGLRGQLETQSFVTGQLVVALDFHPGTPIHLRGDHLPFPEIPTIPSTMQEFTNTIQKLPLEELFTRANAALGALEKTVNSPEVAETLHKANLALGDLQALVQNLNSRIEPLSARADETLESFGNLARNADTGLKDTLADTRKLMKQAGDRVAPLSKKIEDALDETTAAVTQVKKTFEGLKDNTGADSNLIYRLGATLDQLTSAARSIRVWADYLEAHPEALVRGKGGYGGR